MNLRDALDVKVGSTPVNKIYKGTYKVWDRNKIALEGYCKQNTTKGKQLLDYITNLIPTGYGLENTINEDGSITTTGIPLDGYRPIVKITDITDFLEDGEIYSISQLNPDPSLYIQVRIVDKENHGTYLNCATSQSKSFTVDKTNNSSYWIMVQTGSLATWGEESKSITNFYQLEKGTATDFEKYTGGQPSPSPDFEVPIEVMQGRQVVNIKSKNELNYDLEPENKYYDMNGQPVTISGAVYVNQTINLLANTTYTFSYEEKIGDAIVRLCEYKEDGTFIKRTLIQNNNVSIKLNSETSYVITSTNKAPTSMFIKPQIQEGSTASPWVPYKNEQYTVDLKSKNLFDVNQEATTDNLSTEGVTLTINTDGTISTSGSNASPYKYIKYDIELPAGTYIFSGCPAGGSSNGYSSLVQLSSAISSQVIDTGNGNTFTLTETTTIKYFPVRVGSDTVNFNGLVFKPMIRLATVEDDTYEPYYDYKLAGIGDYKDNFYTDKGKWYFKQNIRKMILNGNESWQMFRVPYTNKFQFYIVNNSFKVQHSSTVPFTKSNYFVGDIVSNRTTKNDIIYTVVAANISGFGIVVDDISTIADWKTWLSTHNLEVYYITSEPIITEIPSTYTTLINQLNALYQAM